MVAGTESGNTMRNLTLATFPVLYKSKTLEISSESSTFQGGQLHAQTRRGWEDGGIFRSIFSLFCRSFGIDAVTFRKKLFKTKQSRFLRNKELHTATINYFKHRCTELFLSQDIFAESPREFLQTADSRPTESESPGMGLTDAYFFKKLIELMLMKTLVRICWATGKSSCTDL